MKSNDACHVPDYGVPTGSVPRKTTRDEKIANPGVYEVYPPMHLSAREVADIAAAMKATPEELAACNSEQVGGTHYAKLPIQPWDYVAANGLGYFEGSIVKYVSRWKDKGGVEDLKKARHFLDKLIEVSS